VLKTYTFPEFDYVRSTDQDAADPVHHAVVIVGAGPIGMAVAIDFAQYGVNVVLLDDNNTVSVGSRAICYGKRFLDISDRLGVGQRAVDKGVTWSLGRVFFEDEEIYSFSVQPEKYHRRPGFINLQQYYLEEYMVDRIRELPEVDLRWKNKVTQVVQTDDHVCLTIDTPEGPYDLTADYLIACDGANSTVRGQAGLGFKGHVFRDRFLIIDIVMDSSPYPAERWFWFAPSFHEGQSALLHRQADNVWRINFDLGWGADPVEEKKPENITKRVKAFLGEEVDFELEWVSVYTFTCRRMDEFSNDRIFFAGDAAHQVAPFGARGANAGMEDADNLVWKMKAVMDGLAPARLLGSYSEERTFAADENILNSTRSTNFITPKNIQNIAFRDAVLNLAIKYPFARPLVNSGRLSVPPLLTESSLNTEDVDHFDCKIVPGAPCTDGPILRNGQAGFMLSSLGNCFNGLLFVDGQSDLTPGVMDQLTQLAQQKMPIKSFIVASNSMDITLPEDIELVVDIKGIVKQRLDAQAGTFYLIRPDQLVTARMRQFDQARVMSAKSKALGNE